MVLCCVSLNNVTPMGFMLNVCLSIFATNLSPFQGFYGKAKIIFNYLWF
jgi:hypothetical protein